MKLVISFEKKKKGFERDTAFQNLTATSELERSGKKK